MNLNNMQVKLQWARNLETDSHPGSWHRRKFILITRPRASCPRQSTLWCCSGCGTIARWGQQETEGIFQWTSERVILHPFSECWSYQALDDLKNFFGRLTRSCSERTFEREREMCPMVRALLKALKYRDTSHARDSGECWRRGNNVIKVLLFSSVEFDFIPYPAHFWFRSGSTETRPF